MAVSGKAIKTRIKSVKNTKKMTKAMEMVSAAKMRKSVASALRARSYARLARELLQHLSGIQKKQVPLLRNEPFGKTLLLLVTSNRGLCGSFNANVLKRASLFLKQQEENAVEVLGIGKKSALFAKKFGLPLTHVFDNVTDKPSFEMILSIAKIVLQSFVQKKYNKVVLVFTDYKSPLVQEVKVQQLLPISEKELKKTIEEYGQTENASFSSEGYVFEPNVEVILNDVLPRLVEIQLYQSVLESAASEHSARMMAMKNASSAAGDMIDALTLEFNKARQAAITREISEIVGGAAALE